MDTTFGSSMTEWSPSTEEGLSNPTEWPSNMTEGPNLYGNKQSSTLDPDTLSGATDYLTPVTTVLLCVFVGVACVVGIFCNSLVLLVILLTKSTRSITSCFLINLVTSDLLLCATVFPAILCDIIIGRTQEKKHMPQGVPCQLIGFLTSVFMYSSVTSLSAVSFHRYTNTVHYVRLQYSRVYSFGGLILCWVYSVCWSLGPIFGWGSISYMESRFLCTIQPAIELSFTIMHWFAQFLLPLVTMSICYVKIVAAAYSRTKRVFDVTSQGHNRWTQNNHQMHQQVCNRDPPFVTVQHVKKLTLFPEFMTVPRKIVLPKSGAKPSSPRRFCPPTTIDYQSSESYGSMASYSSSHRETKAMVKLLGLICVFVLTWLPLHINNLMHATNKGKVNRPWDSVAFFLACINSCLNPIFFALASGQFRQNMKKRLLPNNNHKLRHEKHASDRAPKASSMCSVKQPDPLCHQHIEQIVTGADIASSHQQQTSAIVHVSPTTLDEEEIQTMSWISPHNSQNLPSISYKAKQKKKQTTSKAVKITQKKKAQKPLELPDNITITSPRLLHRQTPLPPISLA